MRVLYAAVFVPAVLCVVALRARGSSLEAYAFTAAGESTGGFICGTFAPTPQVSNNIVVGSFEVSTPGPGCGVTQSIMDPTSLVGPIGATSSAAGGSGSQFGSFTYSGSSQSHADYNSFGVQALGTFSGNSDGLSDNGSEGYGLMNDGFTAPLSIGAGGFVEMNYLFHGTQTLNGIGSTVIELLWRKNLGPQFAAVRIMTSNSSPATLSINGEYVTSYPGITLGTTTASANNAALSFLIPASAGEHFALNLVLYGSALPGNGNPSSISDDFIGTVALTSIVGLTASQTPVSDPVLRDSAAVLEPASALLAAGALVWFAALAMLGRKGARDGCLLT
jgi:hypothetical protein